MSVIDPKSIVELPDPSQVANLIRSRRSIKPAQFDGRRIPDSIVTEMLGNANWAPTHGMTQPWRFFVFCDEARETVGQKLAEIYNLITPTNRQKPGKAEKLLQSVRQSSHVIAIAMKRQESEKIPEIEEIEAVACAVQNLHLTATAHRIGGYWSSGGAICCDEFARYLGLAPRDRVLGLFYLGYPVIAWPDGERSPADDRVVWHRTAQD